MPDDAGVLSLEPEVGNATEDEQSWPVVVPRLNCRPATLGLELQQGNAAATESEWPVVSAAPSAEEAEFVAAVYRYKRDNGRPLPTWPEILTVLRSLGYRKTSEPTASPG